MFININDIKNGMTIIMDGNLCTIQEFQHVKPGKGPAFSFLAIVIPPFSSTLIL